jgi:hypothetical protein
MAVPMNSAAFRATVEPILNKEFDGLYNNRADEFAQVFREFNGIPRAYHEEPVDYGFGAAPELPEGTPVTYQAGGQLYMARYNYKVYGLAFALTKVLVEDGDHVRIGQTFARHLAKSMSETKETLGANVLNRSFNSSYAGGDGVALVSASHPTAIGTSSNRLATDANLSQSSLEQMLIQIRNATDSTGRKIRLNPTQIVTGPSNVFQAEVLLKSALRAGTANNDINPVKSMGMLDGGQANLSRITSTTAWWVQTDAPEGLKLAMRRKLEKSAEGDFESDSMRYKSTERYAFGYTDWRGLFGTPGL